MTGSGGAVSESRLVPLRKELDRYLAVAQARQMARAMGFDLYAVTEIETAVSELASNVLHHGVEGEVWLRRRGDRFEVNCLDRGPGFGATTGRPPAGLGVGLAGARRLMDGLVAEDLPGGGARVTTWRRLPPARGGRAAPPDGGGGGVQPARAVGKPFPPPGTPPLQAAAALRAAEGESVCGDAYAVLPLADGLLVAVVDGVGHGPAAALAAERVVEALTEEVAARPEARLPELLHAAHAASRAGRGAAAGLARITSRGAAWAGVGNVAVRWLPDGLPRKGGPAGTAAPNRRISRLGAPGCLGVRWPDAEPVEEPLPGGGLVVITTDGVPADAVEGVGLPAGPPVPARGPVPDSEQALAGLRRLVEAIAARADGKDDALVLAARLPETPPRDPVPD